MKFRNLTSTEIGTLKENGCRADNWETVQVCEGFKAEHVAHVYFSGDIKLGRLDGSFKSAGKEVKPGIYNSRIHNCSIADRVFITDVRMLSNYSIADDVVIQNVGSLGVTGETQFGNGTAIDVLNEGGGRELLIYDQLTAQIAYLSVLYRHDEQLITSLEKLIHAYAESKKSHVGVISSHVRMENCNIIKNVYVGPWCHIAGSQLLSEGTIRGAESAPTLVGDGVIAESFIIHTGSKINGGALLKNCFVGQSVQIGRQFSAENSLFFANSEAFHGEACSLFAGPYTVTHHKSTLLIAALVSFYNAGSGTNQSNHMYKLGPLHQGILERGAKTGSFSYLLWPSRVGAFSAVIGKHFTNFDTSAFPFSYITEENGKSVLTPAMNLFTVGTRRDSEKWPKRDKRTDIDKLDLIHFDLFNPYTTGKIAEGRKLLLSLLEKTEKKQEFVSWKGIVIKRLLLRTCAKYYDLGIHIYLGEQIIKRLEKHGGDAAVLLNDIAGSDEGSVPGEEWVDLCGMVSPKKSVDNFCDQLRAGAFSSLSEVREVLKIIFESTGESEWKWTIQLLREVLDKDTIMADDLKSVVEQWMKNRIKLNNMILKDAEKEFDQNSRYGYGIDGDEEVKSKDFTAVRGEYETNSFVTGLREENETIKERGEKYSAMI